MSSLRREALDSVVAAFERDFVLGTTLDIGGKRVNKRGAWSPSSKPGIDWKFLNTDPATQPDYLVSADNTGLPDKQFDSLIMCELLEHVAKPEKVLREAYRLLKPGGYGLITMPFLNGVHADPEDYQRWTARKLSSAITMAGFEIRSIEAMGSIWAVVYDLFRSATYRLRERRKSILPRLLMSLLGASRPIWTHADSRATELSSSITTGWSVIVYRGPSEQSAGDES